MLEDGLLSSILGWVPEEYRPYAEAGLLLLLAMGTIAALINPIIELGHRFVGLWRWVGRRLTWVWRKVFPPPPPEAPPPNGNLPLVPREVTVWEERAPIDPATPMGTGIPIICVAAMKGGVGKTTVVANLAAYFKRTRSKPVLLIDFDYQGSLSQTIRSEAGYTDPALTSHALISPGANPVTCASFAQEMRRGLEGVFLYSATYPLATIENNLLTSWLNGVLPVSRTPH